MEEELRCNLCDCAARYAKAKKLELSTVGRLAAGDGRFFSKLAALEASFTARKYDETINWFSTYWPADLDWPENINRPEPNRSAA
jgi:hypothetical protein